MHTQGPWTASVVDTINDEPAYWVIKGADGVVGDVQSVNAKDAALIAAAPDLLAVLRRCVEAMDARMPAATALYDARAIISKALGE